MRETRWGKNDLISRNSMLRHFSDWQMECSAVGSEREYNLLDMAIKGIKMNRLLLMWRGSFSSWKRTRKI